MVHSQKKALLAIMINYICLLVMWWGGFWLYDTYIAHNIPVVIHIVLRIYVLWWLFLIPTFIFMRRDKEKPKDIGFSKEKIPRQVIIGLLAGAVSALLWGLISLPLGLVGGYTPEGIGNFLINLLPFVIAVALVEEIIFRGYIFKKFLDIKNSRWLAIVGSSVLFGLFHIVNGFGIQILLTAIVGFTFCLAKEKIKYCSLLSLIIAHGLHNALLPVVIAFFN